MIRILSFAAVLLLFSGCSGITPTSAEEADDLETVTLQTSEADGLKASNGWGADGYFAKIGRE